MLNNNKAMLDRPMWEQLSYAPASGVAGTCLENDGERYIYSYFQTSTTAAQFWRYCTWTDTWQQLATPATQTGSVANLTFTKAVGGQYNGQVFGSVYLFVGNGMTCYWYKYDIATNTWSAALSTTNVPAVFGSDCYVCYPSVIKNNYETNYHSGYVRTITTTSVSAVGATTVAVSALAEALVAGTCLRFGAYDISITSAVSKGATSIAVSGATEAMSAGTVLRLSNGLDIVLSSASLAGATTLSVYATQMALDTSIKIKVEKYAVLTATAAVSATSLTVSALRVGIPSAATAGYYGNMYLVGNNATVMYRYNIGTNAWATTNAAGVAIPAVTGAVGAGGAVKYLPGSNLGADKLVIIRGNATSNLYTYDLVANTFATVSIQPATETFTTGTAVAARDLGGKQNNLLISKDGTNRIYEWKPEKGIIEPKINQWLYPSSSAVVGDRSLILTSPEGIDFFYQLLHSSTAFVRCALIDS